MFGHDRDKFYGSDDSDPDDFKWFTKHIEHPIEKHSEGFKMNAQNIAYIVGTVIVLLLLLSCCCRRKLNQGQVIVASVAPPPPPGRVPYPQQQYAQPVAYPVVTQYPTQSANVSYPHTSPYPPAHVSVGGGSPYPPVSGAPYPTGGAPYPTSNAPYPTAGAPYPTGGAPYPTTGAPSAPDVNAFYGLAPPGWNSQAMPPSYEQATSADYKQSPYNPNMPR